jgi:predicted transcriptional regulator
VRRTKFEIVVDVLDFLANSGSMKITHVAQILNLNSSVLRDYFDFLLKQGLIEEEKVGKKRVVYKISARGLKIFKQIEDVQSSLPILLSEPSRR